MGFETGIKTVDEQHHKLVDTLNGPHDAMKGRGRVNLRRSWTFLSITRLSTSATKKSS
jgi:hypothetical protein